MTHTIVRMQSISVSMVEVLYRQFAPTLQMAADVIDVCTDSDWVSRARGNPFWQYVMHGLIGVQFWFREASEAFAPPDFGDGPVPDLDRIPSFDLDRITARRYLEHIRKRVETFFASLDDRRLLATASVYEKCTYADLILMQTRHIQHHVGYCNCLLRDRGAATAKWSGHAE